MIEVPYHPDRFDEGYYLKGERHGFTDYTYESAVQQQQLAIKWSVASEIPHENALFVGCAMGYELAYWGKHGKLAVGVDVSRYAIEHRRHGTDCRLFDGIHLHWPDSAFGLVAAFDVLTIPPAAVAEALIAEMVRVAKNGIVVRTHIKNRAEPDQGVDGTTYTLKPFEYWDGLFTASGKLKLRKALVHDSYETLFWWARV